MTIRNTLQRIEKILGKTKEEIAEREGITKETISEVCSEMANLPEVNKPAANHQAVDIVLQDRREIESHRKRVMDFLKEQERIGNGNKEK